MTTQFLRACALIAFCVASAAQAVTPTAVRSPFSAESARSPSAGPYAFVEWNPADLQTDRYRLDSEYLVVDGFALGMAAEYESRKLPNMRHSLGAFGLTATQYFDSQVLMGPFVKGEVDAFFGSFETRKKPFTSGTVYGLNLGLDVGYRFVLFDRFTGGAAYGARRVIPDFFDSSSRSSRAFMDNMDLWQMRIQLSLGLVL